MGQGLTLSHVRLEVPQESTGLYGRQVRGPLDILRETWEQKMSAPESVISYISKIHNRLSSMHDIAHQKETASKREIKKRYDKTARARSFEVNESVLVLLPSESNKLEAKWQSPYPVTTKITDVTYQVHMFDRRQKYRIFHVNMLSKWNTPDSTCLLTEEHQNEEVHQPEDIPTWQQATCDQLPTINPTLSPTQKAELQALFADIFQDRPGRTDKATISINTGDAAPVHLPPYRLPRSRHEAVQDEIRDLLQAGIIEPSDSPWASPTVLVPKKGWHTETVRGLQKVE